MPAVTGSSLDWNEIKITSQDLLRRYELIDSISDQGNFDDSTLKISNLTVDSVESLSQVWAARKRLTKTDVWVRKDF